MVKALFKDTIVFNFIKEQQKLLASCADAAPAEVFRRPALGGYIEAEIERLRVSFPLLTDRSHLKPTVADNGADGMSVQYTVPFSGDPRVFSLVPSSLALPNPEAEVSQGRLLLTYRSRDLNPSAVKAEYERDIKNIEEALDVLRRDLSGYLSAVEEEVRASFGRRGANVRAGDEFTKAFT